jgi:large subunit ribosomal protein L15
MTSLHTLSNHSRGRKTRRRVGRGPGSGMGKTCCRGGKGASARTGYKSRQGYEGGQMRLHMKLPSRGFNNIRFNPKFEVVNLDQIEQRFEDGETVNEQSLRDRGFFGGRVHGVKLLGKGTLSKKVTIEVDAASESALEKLSKAKIAVTVKG